MLENAHKGLPEFGSAVRARRKLCCVKLTWMAARVGISVKTLNNIESGRNWPSLPVYFALIHELRFEPAPLQPKPKAT